MKTFLLVLVLALVAGVAVQAQTPDCQSLVGIYTAQNPAPGTAEGLAVYNGPPGVFDVYVVCTNPWNETLGRAIANIGGYEFQLRLPVNVFLLSIQYPPGTVNFATPPVFYCGADIPVYSGNATLATLTMGWFDGAPSTFRIDPVTSPLPSIPGNIAITDYNDNFRLCVARPSSGAFTQPVFGLATPVTLSPCFSGSLQDPEWYVTAAALGESILMGADPLASDGYDAGFDLPDLSPLLTMERPEWNVPGVVQFSRDVRADYDQTIEAKTWPFRVDASSVTPGSVVTVDFARNPAAAGATLSVTDLTTGTIVDISTSLTYAFVSDGLARDLQLTIGYGGLPAGALQVVFGGLINGYSDLGNIVTSSDQATDGYDPGLDVPEPGPPPANYVTVSIEHPDWPLGRRYKKDVVATFDPLTDTRVWPLMVETDQTGQIRLDFAPNFGRNAGVDLQLRDLQTGQVFSLFPALAYVFETAGISVHRFELSVTPRPVPSLSPTSRPLDVEWTLVAPPLKPLAGADDLASIILDQVPGYGYLFAYDTGVGYTLAEAAATAGVGDGFWLATDTAFAWTMDGYPAVTGVTVPLDTGWNLVGYPMWFPGPVEGVRVTRSGLTVPWDEAVASGWVAPVMDYDPGQDDYVSTVNLDTWHAYWFAALQSGVSLLFDWPNFQILPQRLTTLRSTATILPGDSWRSVLSLDDGTGRIRCATVGAEFDATDGYDGRYDEPRPPSSPLGGSSLAILRPDWELATGPALAKDIIAPLDGRDTSWLLRLTREEPGPVTLAWTTVGWPAGADFQLYIPSQNRVVVMSMRATDRVVLPVGEQPLEVVVRTPDMLSDAGDVPFAGYDLKAYPNPFNPMTTLAFTLPRGGDVEVRIYSVRGDLVDVLRGGALGAGPQRLTWRGTARTGRVVSSGTYFARLMVDGQRVGETARLVLVR